MNTSEVAKLLGVSVSTIQRWVKQLELPMERNERGHYLFKEEDVEILKQIHQKIQEGIPLQDIAPYCEKKVRKGSVKADDNGKTIEILSTKIRELETKLNAKADSVATYQLLQHRRELEDLQHEVKTLITKVSNLEEQLKRSAEHEKTLKRDQLNKPKKTKKKNIVSTFFGF